MTEKNIDDLSLNIIILITENNKYTLSVIANKLSVSRKTISQRIKVLKEKGLITRIGSDRNGYWKINNA